VTEDLEKCITLGFIADGVSTNTIVVLHLGASPPPIQTDLRKISQSCGSTQLGGGNISGKGKPLLFKKYLSWHHE